MSARDLTESLESVHGDIHTRIAAWHETPEAQAELAEAFPSTHGDYSAEDENAMLRQYVAGRLRDLSGFVLTLAVAGAERGDDVNTYGLTVDEYLTLAREEMARRGLAASPLWNMRVAK